MKTLALIQQLCVCFGRTLCHLHYTSMLLRLSYLIFTVYMLLFCLLFTLICHPDVPSVLSFKDCRDKEARAKYRSVMARYHIFYTNIPISCKGFHFVARTIIWLRILPLETCLNSPGWNRPTFLLPSSQPLTSTLV